MMSYAEQRRDRERAADDFRDRVLAKIREMRGSAPRPVIDAHDTGYDTGHDAALSELEQWIEARR